MIVVNARFLTQRVTGVQRFAIEISKILHQLNESIVFVTPGNILDQELAEVLGAIVIGKNDGTIWEQIDLRRYLRKQQKPLLINFCNTGVLFYERQIVTIHDMSYRVNPKWFSRKFYLWYNFLIPHIANHSLKIFTVSNSSKNDIAKYLNIEPGKISVIYNSSYLNTNNNFEHLMHERYVLTVSSLDPRKNLNNLISAFKQIEGKIKLIIVGLTSNNFAFSIDEKLLSNRIIFMGYLSDGELGTIITNAEALISISFYEGFGLPAIEAMTFGCPVIVSDIPAHKEICADAALYADPYNIEDIKTKINQLLGNNGVKEKLIIAGKRNIKRFDWFDSANKVLKNINEIF